MSIKILTPLPSVPGKTASGDSWPHNSAADVSASLGADGTLLVSVPALDGAVVGDAGKRRQLLANVAAFKGGVESSLDLPDGGKLPVSVRLTIIGRAIVG